MDEHEPEDDVELGVEAHDGVLWSDMKGPHARRPASAGWVVVKVVGSSRRAMEGGPRGARHSEQPIPTIGRNSVLDTPPERATSTQMALRLHTGLTQRALEREREGETCLRGDRI